MIAAICAIVMFSPAKAPKWLDTTLAGYTLQWDDKHPSGCFQDEKKGFYVMRVPECDGSHLSLVLTRDRKMVTAYSFHVHNLPKALGDNGVLDVTKTTLPNLSTGKGLKIGDTPGAVRAKLGKPTKEELAGNRNQFKEWKYIWRNVRNGEGAEWENIYVFKAGKLIEIRFHRDSVPGCGD